MGEDRTHSRQAADWPAEIAGTKDRAGQAWRLDGLVLLIVSSAPGRGRDRGRSWHRALLLDDPQLLSNAGKLDTFVESPDNPWEEDDDEPSWERIT